jgi:hypothetical protein
MEATMENKLANESERLETLLQRKEKWLYACFGAILTLVAHAFLKAYESQKMFDILFQITEKVNTTNPRELDQYFMGTYSAMYSHWWLLIWLIPALFAFTNAAMLAFHPTWRKVAIAKRLDLIFSFLLAGWIIMLSLGVQDLPNSNDGENVFALIYLFALALCYWWFRRKKDKAEEVFP